MKFFREFACYLFILFSSLQTSISAAQGNSELQKLVDTTNQYYGTSDLLNLGELYSLQHLHAKGHPYFFTNEYASATLTVGNISFDEIKALYNIATDQLIIRTKVEDESLVDMLTKQDWVSSFRINSHLFINAGKFYPGKTVKGYVEPVYHGKKSFFIKYRKEFVDSYEGGLFSIVKTDKYVYDKGEFIPVSNKRAFLKLYNDKKGIKKFMRENKINYSKASTLQLNLLMQFCDVIPKSPVIPSLPVIIPATPHENSELQKLIDTTNQYYGTSDLLNLGELYSPEHLHAKGHPYFITNEYASATLIVGNTSFDEIKALYNIATDQLIIRTKVEDESLVNVLTKQDWVSSFRINSHLFINAGKFYPGKTVKGYVEPVYHGKKSFFIKYRKEFVDSYEGGLFSIVKTDKYVYDKGEFIPVSNKRAFLKLYNDKKGIKKFMRENKINYSKASTLQLNLLMQFCDALPT